MVSEEIEHKLDEVEPSFKEVLQNKNFVKLIGGQFFSNFGDAILRVAMLLYVYSFTGSLTLTTLILSAQIIPWIIIGPIAGVFADRTSRKSIMVIADIIRTVAIMVIPFTENLIVITSISFVIGIASASFTAPRSAAIPEITGMRLFVKGISLSQIIFQTVSIIGPLVGSFVFAVFGSNTFFIASVGFFVSTVFILMTTIPDAIRTDNDMSVQIIISDLQEGISYLFENPVTRNILLLFTFIVFASAYANPLIYPYIYEIIHDGVPVFENQSQREYGIIGSITALGSIVGNLTFGKFEHFIGRKIAILMGSIVLGLYFTSFIILPGIILLAILALSFGFFNGMLSLAVNAVFAEAIPNKIRGRAYSATNAYLQIFTAIFTALSGITADLVGIVLTMTCVGLILLLAVFIFTIVTKMKFLNIGPVVQD